MKLNTVEGSTVNFSTGLVPYVTKDGAVALYAGEVLEVSIDQSDPRHVKFLRTIEHVSSANVKGYHAPDANAPAPAGPAILSVELRQTAGKPNMTLVLRNDAGITLKYDATMFVPTPGGMKQGHTSTCALLPGTAGFESWPHPVAMLLLKDFHRVEPTQLTRQ